MSHLNFNDKLLKVYSKRAAASDIMGPPNPYEDERLLDYVKNLNLTKNYKVTPEQAYEILNQNAKARGVSYDEALAQDSRFAKSLADEIQAKAQRAAFQEQLKQDNPPSAKVKEQVGERAQKRPVSPDGQVGLTYSEQVAAGQENARQEALRNFEAMQRQPSANPNTTPNYVMNTPPAAPAKTTDYVTAVPPAAPVKREQGVELLSEGKLKESPVERRLMDMVVNPTDDNTANYGILGGAGALLGGGLGAMFSSPQNRLRNALLFALLGGGLGIGGKYLADNYGNK